MFEAGLDQKAMATGCLLPWLSRPGVIIDCSISNASICRTYVDGLSLLVFEGLYSTLLPDIPFVPAFTHSYRWGLPPRPM